MLLRSFAFYCLFSKFIIIKNALSISNVFIKSKYVYQALVVLILFSLTPSHGRPKPIFPIPILTTLPALTETQLLWLLVGASGGAGVALGAQGISNIAQVFMLCQTFSWQTCTLKLFVFGENHHKKRWTSHCPKGKKLVLPPKLEWNLTLIFPRQESLWWPTWLCR